MLHSAPPQRDLARHQALLSPEEDHALPVILPVHACVPGRVRWHVGGLRGDPVLKAVLEDGLSAYPGVEQVSASTDTGNVLTRFDPAVPLERIRARIAALLRGEAPATAGGRPAAGWHARIATDVSAELGTSPVLGLTAADARERLAEHGANRLPVSKARSGIEIFLGQWQTLPVLLLAGAAAFSFFAGGLVEAIAIASVIGSNAVLGTLVEIRSERTISSLGSIALEPAHVVRDGVAAEIGPEGLVPGDLIDLRPGMVVPADGRVVSARDLCVTEAMLTGESLPVAKHARAVQRGALLADRASMVFRGTAVTGGSGKAVVVATGAHTEMGRIQRMIARAGTPQTPMQRQLEGLGRQLVWASLAACAAVVGLGALRGIALLGLLRSGVSLAVAAIPEGLPTVATTTLALGIEDMRRRGVLVRRLDAVETLASVSAICFDKTGTLTLNQMRVTDIACDGRHFRIEPGGALLDRDDPVESGDGIADPPAESARMSLLRVGVLCSDAGLTWRDGALVPLGSPTENALVRLAIESGLDVQHLREQFSRVAVRHRSEGYRFMATAHRQPDSESGETVLIAAKGSPSEVLELCEWELCDGVRRPLTAERRSAIEQLNEQMAAEALRVLGFALGEAPESVLPETGNGDEPHVALPVAGLCWLGLAGLADPVRPGITELMRGFHQAGLRTVMMTGDQVPTALAVARRLGLSGDAPVEVLDVAELDRMSDADLASAAGRVHVFARISPAQKLRLVRAMQASGQRVAMIGDGINDSPALKAADVGFAMGGAAASEAARDVADVILQADDLTMLAVALERGRTTHVNVRKSIRYLLATNLSEILVVLGATAAGFGEPLTAMQLLWINLISDVLPGLGLAFEPSEPDLVHDPKRVGEILDRSELRRLAVQGGLISAGSLAAYGYGTLRYGPGAQARTMGFGALVTAQLLHALTARSDRRGLFASGACPLAPNRPLSGLLLASVGVQALGLLLPGVRGALGLASLGPLDLLVTAAAGFAPYVANEASKLLRAEAPSAPPGVADAAGPPWNTVSEPVAAGGAA